MKHIIAVLTGTLLLAVQGLQAQFITATNNGTITITGFTGVGFATIPTNINGLTVTAIGSNAFAGSPIFSVTIPNTVTNIGAGAFMNCHLSSMSLGNGIVSIGDNAFLRTMQFFTNLILPASVISVGNGAFNSCALNGLTIPNSVTSIGDLAFGYTFLTSVLIPGSVTNLGGNPFGGCSSLGAIGVDTNNPAYIGIDGIVFNKSQTALIAYAPGRTGNNYTISNNILSIGTNAFNGSDLTNVIIPANVTNIVGAPFAGSPMLTFNVDPGNPAFSSVGGVLFDKSQTKLIEYPRGPFGGTYEIPVSVTSIGDSAFASTFLSHVGIPGGVTNIGRYAFYGSRVANLILPEGLTSIAEGGLAGCQNLITIIIPAAVTNLGSKAFYSSIFLRGVYFQSNAPIGDVTVFGDSGPRGYDAGAKAYYLPGTSGWSNSFYGIPTAVWTPAIQTNDGFLGVQGNQFGFNISWASNYSVTVSANSNVVISGWSPVTNVVLTNGLFYFSEPVQSGAAGRFYRVSWP